MIIEPMTNHSQWSSNQWPIIVNNHRINNHSYYRENKRISAFTKINFDHTIFFIEKKKCIHDMSKFPKDSVGWKKVISTIINLFLLWWVEIIVKPNRYDLTDFSIETALSLFRSLIWDLHQTKQDPGCDEIRTLIPKKMFQLDSSLGCREQCK